MNKKITERAREYQQTLSRRHQSSDGTIVAIQSQIGWLKLLEVLVGEERGRELFNEIVVGHDLSTG
ncbi:MAG: hypothetical protein GWQ05_00150 [Verrucomicrobiaceae bacterium]|nr:hypothetical protein [Verrucomicrobiaceae bacterium]NCF89370.1 hypothetical protein [Verrucomicrobiaceae bacterium]